MQIDITSHSGEYSFSINGQTYVARSPMLALRYKMSVYSGNDSSPMLVIKQKSSMLSVSFEITRADQTSLLLKVKSAVKHHFQCKAGSDIYDIYGHKIETCSLYKNDVQVAWWDLKYSEALKIIANSDCDPELLIAFYLLTVKLIQVRNDGQGIVQNLVTNISEERAFDAAWQPHSSPPPLPLR